MYMTRACHLVRLIPGPNFQQQKTSPNGHTKLNLMAMKLSLPISTTTEHHISDNESCLFRSVT